MGTAFLTPPLNYIQKKDIHTRKELWKQKIKLFDLKKFDKNFWDKSYDFLPLPKTYQRIRDKVKDWIEKNKESEGKFLELQKKVGEELVRLAQEAEGFTRNTETGILELFELDEVPQPDLARLKELRKCAFALKRNDWEGVERVNGETVRSERIRGLVAEWKEIKEWLREPCFIVFHANNSITFTYHNSNGADLGLNYGFLYRNKLYFVKEWAYIDNAKLFVRVEAKVDLVYLYYGNFLRSAGVVKLKRGPLFLEDLEKPLAESNKLHYSFCDDKGNLRMAEPFNPDIQPKIKTFMLDLKGDLDTSKITMFNVENNGNTIQLPNNLNLVDIDNVGGMINAFANWWNSTTVGSQTLAFLAPADYPQIVEGKPSIQYIKYSKGNEEAEMEFIKIPDVYVKYPHLIHESTVQIFFLNKLTHQGFLNQFALEERGGTNPDGNNAGKYIVLKYLCSVRANPSGIYYLFESDTQTWKDQLSISQTYNTKNFFQKVLGGLAEKYGGFRDLYDLSEETPDEKPENEENSRRKYKNPNKSGSKDKPLLTPDLLYANTVDLKYDFFEFANRYTYPMLKFRFQYSNDLKNNLRNCNNKSHEFDLDLTFAQLGVLINKPGEYQGELKLKEDNNGFMREIFAKRVFFYEDLEKDLPNPDLKLEREANLNLYSTSDASIMVGDETMESATFTHQISYQADRREYSHATWFCFSDREVQESFHRACSCRFSHYYNNAPNTTRTGWCWGCTYDDLARSNFLATSFTPQTDCQFVYCLEVGQTPTIRQLQGGITYNFTFTSTDILISWNVHTRTTETIDPPTINQDSLQEQQQPDQAEELADVSDLEENEGEEELSEGEQQEEEETESESSDDEEEVENSEDEEESSEDEESSEESESSEEEEESEDEVDDDEEQSEEE